MLVHSRGKFIKMVKNCVVGNLVMLSRDVFVYLENQSEFLAEHFVSDTQLSYPPSNLRLHLNQWLWMTGICFICVSMQMMVNSVIVKHLKVILKKYVYFICGISSYTMEFFFSFWYKSSLSVELLNEACDLNKT